MIKLDGLTKEQKDLLVFKMFYEMGYTKEEVNKLVDWLFENRTFWKVALKGINIRNAKKEARREIDNNLGIDKVYATILSKMRDLSLELKLNNSLELSNLFTYLLWNGYLSKSREYYCNINNRNSLDGLYFADIMNNGGVCLNHADMLVDFLKINGYDSMIMANFLNMDTSIYPVTDLKREFIIDSSSDQTKKLNLKQKLVKKRKERKESKGGNHAFTLIKENNNFYIYDATNLAIFELNSYDEASVINGKGISHLKLFNSFLVNRDIEQITDLSLDFLGKDSFTCPYNEKEFYQISNSNYDLFKSNTLLLDDFYADIRDDILGIAENLVLIASIEKVFKLTRKI